MFRRKLLAGDPVWLATSLNSPAVEAIVVGPGCVRAHRMVELQTDALVRNVSRPRGTVMEVRVTDLAPRRWEWQTP